MAVLSAFGTEIQSALFVFLFIITLAVQGLAMDPGICFLIHSPFGIELNNKIFPNKSATFVLSSYSGNGTKLLATGVEVKNGRILNPTHSDSLYTNYHFQTHASTTSYLEVPSADGHHEIMCFKQLEDTSANNWMYMLQSCRNNTEQLKKDNDKLRKKINKQEKVVNETQGQKESWRIAFFVLLGLSLIILVILVMYIFRLKRTEKGKAQDTVVDERQTEDTEGQTDGSIGHGAEIVQLRKQSDGLNVLYRKLDHQKPQEDLDIEQERYRQ